MENKTLFEGWRGFREGSWVNEIDLRSFIRHNFTMYDGDESFLEGPTENTVALWEQVMDLTRQERETGGVLDMDTKVVSSIISHGPGSPEDAGCISELIGQLMGQVPMFGIDLGCQLIALACGGKVHQMKSGHRGSNHPIRDLRSGKIEFALQNHAFAVCGESLEGSGLEVTHRNLLDGTVEGVADPARMVMAVQYYPGSVSGSRGVSYLYEEFVDMMNMAKRGAENA